MHILSSMRSITFPWSRSSNEDADDASSDSGEDPEADSDDDSTSVGGFSKAKILYTTLVILLLFGTVFGGGFATSAAVQHSKANSAAFYEQLEDPGEVSSLGVDRVMQVARANFYSSFNEGRRYRLCSISSSMSYPDCKADCKADYTADHHWGGQVAEDSQGHEGAEGHEVSEVYEGGEGHEVAEGHKGVDAAAHAAGQIIIQV